MKPARPPNPAAGTDRAWRSSYEHWSDLPVHCLVIEKADFIVFLDSELDVDWKTTDAHDEANKSSQHDFGKILTAVTSLEAISIAHMRREHQLAFRRILGEAVARALENDVVGATEAIRRAENYIAARNQEHSRFWYVTASGAATAAIVVACTTVWLLRSAIEPRLGALLTSMFPTVAAGAVGALFSVLTRVTRTSLEPSAGPKLHYLEGSSRIVLGAIAACVIALAIRAGLVVPQLTTAQHASELLLLVSMAAGASERLVPSLVEHLETKLAPGAKRKKQARP